MRQVPPVTGTNVANADVFKSSVRAAMLGGSTTSCTSRDSKRHAAEWTDAAEGAQQGAYRQQRVPSRAPNGGPETAEILA
jgi:hypothetical protein